MANTIGTCLSEDWEAIDTDVRLHIPTMWEISEYAKELNGGGRRIILLDLETYFYVLIGNIGDDFALDVYTTTDEEAYDEMLSIFKSFDKDEAV